MILLLLFDQVFARVRRTQIFLSSIHVSRTGDGAPTGIKEERLILLFCV